MKAIARILLGVALMVGSVVAGGAAGGEWQGPETARAPVLCMPLASHERPGR